MKKIILILLAFMLWAFSAAAEQAATDKTEEDQSTEVQGTDFEGRVGLGYRDIKQNGNPIAGEYDYIKSSATGALDMEWDPLPHRFVLESYFLNHKDYFGELDYAYKDVVLFNMYGRGLFHNLNHASFGPASADPNVNFTDKDPGASYGIENSLRRAFIRFKTPDFPFHLYSEVITVDREGTIQQRFMREFTAIPTDKVSQSRDIDWNMQQVRVGANSHLGPVEVDYSHMEKKFEAREDKVLYDGYQHNLIPDLKSSSDTVKVHSSYAGRLVLAGTYSSGNKKNEDSAAKVKFWNSAGDIIFMPVTSVVMAVKYRHYTTDATNPDSVNNATGTSTVNVRDAISSSRDVVTGTLRYRATDRLTLKGEYAGESIDRTVGTLGTPLTAPPANADASWDVAAKTTKGTAKLNLTYRVMNKLTVRADYAQTKVANPAYDTDPDKAHTGKASITWMPSPRFNTLLSYSGTRESRDKLGAPLGGGRREAARDQGLASATALVSNWVSVTMSYAYFKNKVDQTITLVDGTTGAFALDQGVPYADTAHVGSLVLTVAPADGVNFTASGTRSYSRGNYVLGGAGGVTNTSGLAELSDMKVIDSVYAAGVEMQHSRNVSSEIRYQYREYDDRIDDTQDGTVKTILATLSMKW
jgi:hypothetical protein